MQMRSLARRADCTAAVVELGDSQRNGGDRFALMFDAPAVKTLTIKLHTLKREDDVARNKRDEVRSEAHFHGRGHWRHAFGSGRVHAADDEFVLAGIFRLKNKANGDAALGMHYRKDGGTQCVKAAEQAQLAIVIGGEVRDGGGLKRHGSEGLVGTVAERWILGLFAIAEPDFLCFGQGEFLWTESGALVGAITVWLMTAEAAGAPPVVSGWEFNGHGLLVVNLWERFHAWSVGEGGALASRKMHSSLQRLPDSGGMATHEDRRCCSAL
jgi:hypothetical protein